MKLCLPFLCFGWSFLLYSVLESVKYNLRVNLIERIGAMQHKKCFLIAVLLFLLTGFLVLFQPMRALLSVSASAYAPPPVDWTNGAGYGCSVKQTADNGYIMAGGEDTRPEGCWLAKIDKSGNLEWKRIYSKLGYEYSGRAAQQTEEGGYMLVGMAREGTATYCSAFLCKTDETGGMLWNRTYGREGHHYFVSSGQQTDDGGFVLAGSTEIVGGEYGSNVFLMKTDVSGNVEWNKTYGGIASEYAYSIQQTSDHGYILAGETYSFGAGYSDCYLAKTDSFGNMQWNKTYGTDLLDSASSVRQTMDGGYIFVGYYYWDGGQKQFAEYAIITKTDSNGGIEWTDSFSGEDPPTGRAWAEACSVDETSDGGFIVAGDASRSDGGRAMFLLKTHSQGNATDWRGTYIENAGVHAVIQTTDGGYAVTGVCGLMKIMPESVVILARFRYSPATPIINESIVFNANYSYDRNQDIVSYLWNFDDGNITSIMNPIVVHRYKNAGIYNVSLRVVDAEGLNSTCSGVLCVMTPTSFLLSTTVPSASVGCSVNISATLLDLFGNRIGNETVDLYYAFSGFGNWNAIASERTDTFGGLSAEWIPPAPSYFVIKAVYAGNYTHVGSSKNVTLSMLPYGEAYLFSVESNSTVSSMGFDTNSQMLSFTATGAGGTMGYAKVTAAKSLIPDLTLLSVYVDGAEYDYNVTEANDSWVLLFAYDHSAHLVEIQLDSTIPELTPPTLLLLFIIVTLFAVMICRRRSPSEEQERDQAKQTVYSDSLKAHGVTHQVQYWKTRQENSNSPRCPSAVENSNSRKLFRKYWA